MDISIYMNDNSANPILQERINQCPNAPLTRNLSFQSNENVRLTLRAFYFGTQARFIEQFVNLVPRNVVKSSQIIIRPRPYDPLTIWVQKYRINQRLGNNIEEVLISTNYYDYSFPNQGTIPLEDCFYYKYYVISWRFLTNNNVNAAFAYNPAILSYPQYWIDSNAYAQVRLLGKIGFAALVIQ